MHAGEFHIHMKISADGYNVHVIQNLYANTFQPSYNYSIMLLCCQTYFSLTVRLMLLPTSCINNVYFCFGTISIDKSVFKGCSGRWYYESLRMISRCISILDFLRHCCQAARFTAADVNSLILSNTWHIMQLCFIHLFKTEYFELVQCIQFC